MHFYGWKNGLKTGMYYLRTRAAVDAIKFTLNIEELIKATDGNDTEKVLKILAQPKEEIKEKIDTKNNEILVTFNKNDKENEVCISCQG